MIELQYTYIIHVHGKLATESSSKHLSITRGQYFTLPSGAGGTYSLNQGESLTTIFEGQCSPQQAVSSKKQAF